MRTYTTTVRYGPALNFHEITMEWETFPLVYLAIIKDCPQVAEMKLRSGPRV